MSGHAALSFEFIDDTQDFSAPNYLVVRLTGRYRRKRDLLRALAHALKFPGYFGDNWDALEECLCDLSWLDAPAGVVLLHKHLPLEEEEQRQTYLDILRRAQSGQRVPLRVIFPQSTRDQLHA